MFYKTDSTAQRPSRISQQRPKLEQEMARHSTHFLLALAVFAASALSAPNANDCTGTISSLDDVSAAVKCTTVNINSFTVPAGKTFNLALASGTTVNMLGDVTFGTKNWDGPLFQVSGSNIVFNGNGHTFNGNGPFYWDGQGGNGGVTKPAPMMKIKISGTWTNVKVLNSPARVYSVSNPAPLTMSKLTIDNSLGDQPNANSDGKAAGHNTDGFDCSTTNLVIEDSTIMNQDDCLAINKGSNITFQRNTCSGGHGISVGSISSGVTVSNILIKDNTIKNNDQALRIKTDASASGSTVSGIAYSGNTATGIKKFGILIDQSYPDTLGTPGTGVKLSGVSFTGSQNSISVNSDAKRVEVNCGSGSCTGSWDWSALKVSGGSAGKIVNFSGIQNFSQ
ncbi:endo-polygalacturonase PG1 [Cristinia sonorae]|uniref:endo-polygalacturonase n=1 Tax=Cristinia sonorae TaxID=1940300 RepID=A0A8K0URA2_9AGAR|nr:endo-polygalacturonase PG1 [Cristinia sonorae]